MLDIARVYHPAYSNDPRILACAPPCPKSPTAVQRALPRQEHNAAADRGSRLKSTLGSCSPTPPVATTACPARRVGPRLRAVDASTHRGRSRHRAHRQAPLVPATARTPYVVVAR